MVLTLWTSTKAKKVVKTTIDLSRQDKTEERFESNALSRGLVNAFVRTTGVINRMIPTPIQNLITKQFTQPTVEEAVIKKGDLPAFDNVRASVLGPWCRLLPPTRERATPGHEGRPVGEMCAG